MPLALILAGCDRGQISVYRVAKEPSKPASSQAAQGPQDAHNHGAPTMPKLKWDLPAGWEEQPPSEMRLASFSVKAGNKSADIGVFPLPGLAGGDLGNVNRWRAQVGLEPVKEDALEQLAQAIQIAGQPGRLFDMAGENPSSGDATRILAGMVRIDQVAWFFKMTGDDQLVASQKQNFTAFLNSLKFVAAEADLPPNHPAVDSASMAAQASSLPQAGDQPKPKWEVPQGWKEVSGGPFLVTKFVIEGDGGQAAVNVSRSAGDGGGVAGNVNRWRKQVGLGELTEAEIGKQITKVTTAGGEALVIEMAGTDAKTGNKTSVIGAIVPAAGQTWFYKLAGPEALVTREKNSFLKFLQSAKDPNAA